MTSVGKHQTKMYLEIVSMLENESTSREIRMKTGAADAYVSIIRKSLNDPK